ncbi:MAG: hypothetical protein K1X88_25425 [Nannocystaceae bacterium]|nr:hypothetical protein [Nannocystaceae bacterium]
MLPIRFRRSFRVYGRIHAAGVLGVMALASCADPCLDDGLLQDQNGGNCPMVSGSATDTATGETESASATDSDSAGDACNDGVRNGDETDVDCGGSCPAGCGDGQGCMADGDCASGDCEGGTCQPTPTCEDGVQNGDETDVDCGGTCPDLCGDGQGCAADDDCESGMCDPETMTCGPGGSCRDGMMNGDETDIDCGGSCKTDCMDGQGCLVGDDCISSQCDPKAMICTSCSDGAQNGDETDVDCGGSCPDDCDDGQGCLVDDDCVSNSCDPDTMVCLPPATCRDGAQNGDETDVDCGGDTCPGCDDGETCMDGGDCLSQVCDPKSDTCTPPACDDGVHNGAETDVDCGGGTCPDCNDGEDCLVDDDCLSGSCDDVGLVCLPPACDDGVQNGDETDVDCGGSCVADCDDGEGCLVGDDCISQVCDPAMFVCLPPACDDGVQNGNETDLDCGGSCGATCETGEDCLTGLDCIDGVCDQGTLTCAPPLTVTAAPSCSEFSGTPVQLNATASGGTGNYTYSWSPAAGLDDATISNPLASPTGFETYTVTVDDGVSMAQDSVTVIESAPFNLQNNCTLFQGNFDGPSANASITYSQGGTVACENGNNDFGLHLCSGVVFQDVLLEGVLGVSNDANDDDMIGLVWGAQDSSHFYSMTWKRIAQNWFGCNVPTGITVKRVEAANFAALTGADVYCPADTAGSTLLLTPAATTTAGWAETETYTVAIAYTTTGSSVTVTRDSDSVQMAQFDVNDATFPSGSFGSTTFSQTNACVGPLNASCL